MKIDSGIIFDIVSLDTNWSEIVEYYSNLNNVKFNIGDWVVISKYPHTWSDKAGKYPGNLEYPFIGEIQSDEIDCGGYVGRTISGYGFVIRKNGEIITSMRLATAEELENYKKGRMKNLKAGDWVYSLSRDKAERICNYGTDSRHASDYQTMKDGYFEFIECYRIASKEEIERALIVEANNRGYKPGVIINSMSGNNEYTLNNSPSKLEIANGQYWLRQGGFKIYDNETDSWAEIIENKIFDVVHAKNDDYNVEIVKEGIKHVSDGKIIPIDIWKKMMNVSAEVINSEFPFTITVNKPTISIGCAKEIPSTEFVRIYNIWTKAQSVRLNTQKRAKVIKCDKSDFWYSNHIGESFVVIGEDFADWKVKRIGEDTDWIDKNDAQIIS